MLKISTNPTASTTFSGKQIIYIGRPDDELLQQLEAYGFSCRVFQDPFLAYVNSLSEVYKKNPLPYAFICREDLPQGEAYKFISNLQKCPELNCIPNILYNPDSNNANIRKAKSSGADDLYSGTFPLSDMLERIEFLHSTKKQYLEEKISAKSQPTLRISNAKRVFDILISSILLIVFSPIFLLIALAIKLESQGPVFYISKRVGTGYRIFDFYKFRSMRTDADKMIKDLIHMNQYKSESGATFVKIDNDPRVTPLGKFLRNTSLDELPQLINVFLGDMSIVGNRPLPLYEAEQITRDLWSKRFLAPAGITGLWQVTKRGRKEMSAEERIALDMTYADRCSLWYDLKIVAQTVPALLQKESV